MSTKHPNTYYDVLSCAALRPALWRHVLPGSLKDDAKTCPYYTFYLFIFFFFLNGGWLDASVL